MIPYGKQHIDKADIAAVSKALKNEYLTQGSLIEKFEKLVSKYVGSKYAVAVSSCTAGLHLSAKVSGLNKNNQLLTSANTFVSTANSALYCGSKVVFSDIDPFTGNMSIADIENILKKNKKIKALSPVHFSGVPLNMKKIHKISKKYKLFVYEDAAHALGSRYIDGSRVGNCKYSDLTVFSFHPIKSITTGEGGLITTNNKKIYEKLKRLRSHGIEKFSKKFVSKKNSSNKNKNSPWYFEMQELGYHYRITDIQCALGITQLKKINKFIKKRESISKRYDLAFKNVLNCKILQKNLKKWSSHHLYVLKIDFNKINISKSEFMNKLKKKGIITQVHYIPVYLHPFYRNKKESQKKLKNTEEYYEQALSIPIYYDLKEKDQKYVIDNIKKIIK